MRFEHESFEVQDEAGRRGKIDSVTPLETIDYLDGTFGEMTRLARITMGGRPVSRISNTELRDLDGTVWRRI